MAALSLAGTTQSPASPALALNLPPQLGKTGQPGGQQEQGRRPWDQSRKKDFNREEVDLVGP